MNPFARLFGSLVERVRAKRRVALCAVVGSHGSTPQGAGASMVLYEDMTTEGTLGGGCVEAEVRKRAFELLQRGESGLLTFKLDHDYGWDDGLICGGTMRVAVQTFGPTFGQTLGQAVGRAADETAAFERATESLGRGEAAEVSIVVRNEGKEERYRLHIEAPAKLIIAGAGHVGAELARMAVGLDFEVSVVDDRGDMMGAGRLPPPIRAVVGDIEATLRGMRIDGGSYVVIVTRGHKHDEQALHAVIESGARYIGMIGSRRKVKLIFDDLEALGVGREKLERVHAPIGLEIGGATVPEIALSIAAELVKVRRERGPTRVEREV